MYSIATPYTLHAWRVMHCLVMHGLVMHRLVIHCLVIHCLVMHCIVMRSLLPVDSHFVMHNP